MSPTIVVSLLLAVCLLSTAAPATAVNTFACHYSTGVSAHVGNAPPASWNMEHNGPPPPATVPVFATVPLGQNWTLAPSLYESLVSTAQWPDSFPYTALAYQQDLHFCSAGQCPAGFPGPQFISTYATPSTAGSAFPYTLEALQAQANYTLYSQEVSSPSNCSAAATAVLTSCCLYNALTVQQLNGSELAFYNQNLASYVTRVEHPKRPGGCSAAFGSFVLAASFTVADPALCQLSLQQSVYSPTLF